MTAISQGELDATWEQLQSVPRLQLETALSRTRDLGAACFKAKDYRKAYEYYNTVVTGAEFLQQTGSTPEDATAVVNAISNRSASKLGFGDAVGALKDAAKCVQLRPAWQKGWYRFGRALFAQDRVVEAEAAFAEGIQLDPANGEMLRWRARCRRRIEELRILEMRARRYRTDYDKFHGAEAEADVADEEMQIAHRKTDAPVVDTVEEMHDIMNKKQQAELDRQAPTNIYFRTDMAFLPQAESPRELEEQSAFAAMAVYLEQTSSLHAPMRAIASLHQPHVTSYTRALRRVGARLGELGIGGLWLHLGVGCGVPLLASAALDAAVVSRVAVLPAHGSPFCDTMAARLLERHNLRDRVDVIRQPVEQVLIDSPVDRPSGEEQRSLARPALVLVIDPDLFDEGLLGHRVLPYVRHARRALCVPAPLVVPRCARVFCAPAAITTPPACGFDLRAMDEYRWGPWYEEIDIAGSLQREHGGLILLAESLECFTFDFGAQDVEAALPLRDRRTLIFEAAAAGVLNGVVFWFCLNLAPDDGNETFSTAPDLSDVPNHRPTGALQQAIQWVDPVTVARGATITITASHASTRITFEVTSPERMAPAVHRHAISRWHFEMVADDRRNAAFRDGIRCAVAELTKAKAMAPSPRRGHRPQTCEVVDFGTGSGLLALMAAEAGATLVTGFDNQGHIVNVARRLVKQHGYENVIRLIRKDCRQLIMGKDLRKRADLLVMELFDYGFLGEGCLHFVHFAWNTCLHANGAILPQGGRILAMLVELAPREVAGFDVSSWVTYRFQADYYGLDLRNHPHVRLSEPFEVFDFDFSRAFNVNKPPEAGDEWRDDVPVTRDGRLNAIVFWHEIHIWGDVKIKTGPDDPRTCWYQACQQVEELNIIAGSRLPLRSTHQGSRVTFGVDRDALDYQAMRTENPLYDPLWLQIHNRLVEQSAKLEKTMVFNSEARQQATDAVISISVDPARFGRAGRYIDGSKALQFAWSFFLG